MKLQCKKYKLRLKNPFVLSYGAYQSRWSFIVTIDDRGQTGLGEATAIEYYNWSSEKLERAFSTLEMEIQNMSDIEHILQQESLLPPVRNALQTAYVDLLAKIEGVSIASFYQLPPNPVLPLSSITITGNTKRDLEDQILRYDWPIYKIKMGSEQDDIRLQVIAAHPDKQFRIDANAGWKMSWINKNVLPLAAPNIELIEQPFPIDDVDSLLAFRKIIDKPIYADESCQTIDDIPKCAEYFDGVNIKLMKAGGSDRALELMEAAKKYGMQIMIGCMTESSIGISHASQLLALVDKADIDGAVLIENDQALGAQLIDGKVVLSKHPGSGAVLKAI